jgi:methylenetetrahydrofolate reductase (NADPH)
VNTFREVLERKQFAISAELTLQRDSRASDIKRQSDVLGPYVDAIQVTDIPYGWIQMSAFSAAAILLEQGCDAIPILTCRDRNRAALRRDLLGLQAIGVSSVFLMRGHRLPATHPVQARPVFDLTGRELIAMAAEMTRPQEQGGGEAFLIGVGARAFRPVLGWNGDSLAVRADAGARFLQTQLCMNLNLLRHYMRRLEESGLTREYAVIVSVSPLPSAKTALWMRKNMKDSRIPDPIIRQLEDADDPEAEGVRICARLMQKIAKIPGVSGINLMTTGNPETIPAAIEASGLRS